MERPLAYRILRYVSRAASRAAADVVERAMQRAAAPEPRGVRRGGGAPASRVVWRAAVGPVAVTFEGRGSGEVERGTTILDAAKQLDVDIDHYCGGNSSCGTCRVVVLEGRENLSRQESMEQMALGHSGVAAGDRLACQTRLLGPARLQIPDWF